MSDQSNNDDKSNNSDQSAGSFFVFHLGDVRLGVRAQFLDNILENSMPSPLPQAPSYLLGVIPFGQEALPVVDLSKFLQLGSEGADGRKSDSGSRLLVVSVGDMRVGLMVDRAEGLIEVYPEKSNPPEIFKGGRLKDFLSAEVDHEGSLVGLLDIEALVESSRV